MCKNQQNGIYICEFWFLICLGHDIHLSLGAGCGSCRGFQLYSLWVHNSGVRIPAAFPVVSEKG